MLYFIILQLCATRFLCSLHQANSNMLFNTHRTGFLCLIQHLRDSFTPSIVVASVGHLSSLSSPVIPSSKLPGPGNTCMIVDLISLLSSSVSMNLTLKYELEDMGDALVVLYFLQLGEHAWQALQFCLSDDDSGLIPEIHLGSRHGLLTTNSQIRKPGFRGLQCYIQVHTPTVPKAVGTLHGHAGSPVREEAVCSCACPQQGGGIWSLSKSICLPALQEKEEVLLPQMTPKDTFLLNSFFRLMLIS